MKIKIGKEGYVRLTAETIDELLALEDLLKSGYGESYSRTSISIKLNKMEGD